MCGVGTHMYTYMHIHTYMWRPSLWVLYTLLFEKVSHGLGFCLIRLHCLASCPRDLPVSTPRAQPWNYKDALHHVVLLCGSWGWNSGPHA